MAYHLLADIVVLIHGAFIIFVLGGGFLVLKGRRWAWLHLPAVFWAAYIEVTAGICPLTPLEDHLRAAAGQAPLPGDFIERYITAILYPDELTAAAQVFLGAGAVIVNILVYLYSWPRSLSRRKQRG